MNEHEIKTRITDLAVKSSCAPLLIDFKETLSEMKIAFPEHKTQIEHVREDIFTLMTLFEGTVQENLDQFLKELKLEMP